MTTYTPRFAFPIPDFNTKPWQANMASLINRIDEVIYQSIIAGGVRNWANQTAFEEGELVVDTNDDGTFWTCIIDHTSANAPTTFVQDRQANPTYWASTSITPENRGAWQTATDYKNTDFITHGYGFYCCLISHTAGTFSADLASGYWTTLIDLTDTLASVNASVSSINEFLEVYLGVHATDPTLSNTGAALTDGALYFNDNTDVLKVYTTGTGWVSISASAPSDGTYVVRTTHGSLSQERALTDGASAGLLVWDWSVASQLKGKVIVSAGDKILYSTAANSWSETGLSSYMRTVLDDTTAAAARATLGAASVSGESFSGDITTYRAGAPTTGVIFFGNSGGKYLYYNGTNFQLTATLAVSGDVAATNFSASGSVGGATITSTNWLQAYNGVCYLNSAFTAYVQYNAGEYNVGGNRIHHAGNLGSLITDIANTTGVSMGSGAINANSTINAGGSTYFFGNNPGVYWQWDGGGTINTPQSIHSNGNIDATGAIIGFGGKFFAIEHPSDATKTLWHASLEGPETGVYYRGKAVLSGETAVVVLPDYFTALVHEAGATVSVTSIKCVPDTAGLAVSEVSAGQFTVYRLGSTTHDQPFHWRVEAERKGAAFTAVTPRSQVVPPWI